MPAQSTRLDPGRGLSTIAVTGGTGFIGTAVVRQLERRGLTPNVVDMATGCDMLDPGLDARLRDCDGVIHLAGRLGTAELFDQVDDAIDVNVKGTARVLQACAKYSLRYVGITMPSVWNNVYQATKRAAFELASAWNQHYGVPVSHVRAFNVYGRGQKVHGVRKLVPTFATRAWQGESLPIWGDGTQTVDLVHVDDVARMLVDALRFGDSEVLDAGTGVPVTVAEVAGRMIDITKSRGGVEHFAMREGEHATSIVADGEGWHLLDWRPQPCPQRFRETVEWYREPRR